MQKRRRLDYNITEFDDSNDSEGSVPLSNLPRAPEPPNSSSTLYAGLPGHGLAYETVLDYPNVADENGNADFLLPIQSTSTDLLETPKRKNATPTNREWNMKG